MEQTEQSARSVIADFMEDRLGLNDEGEPVEEADPDIFKAIVDGTVERQEVIDSAIMKRREWLEDRAAGCDVARDPAGGRV
jgi:N utilization substance protein B